MSEPNPRRWLMLPVVLMAMFMAGFDIWAVNVAAPSLQHDLHVSDAALQLIVGGYAFMYASGMVTGGRLGDLFGYRRMFMIGVVTFAAASLLCGLSRSSGELVAARLVQGLTGAVMVPQVLALITATFPPAERPKALSWFGVTMGLGFVSGQILGGGLLSANVFGLSWRAIFLVNVPVGIAALVASAKLVPHAFSQRRPRLDPLGALGVSGSLALALVPLTLGRSEGWPVWTWVAMALALPVLGLTLLWERHLAHSDGQPLLDLVLFRDRAFSAGLVVNFGLVFFFGSFMFVLTLLLQEGLAQSPIHAGIEALPLAFTFTLASILGPRFASRLGPRSITLGASIAALGTFGLAFTGLRYGASLTGWDLAPATAVIGLGQGIALPSLIGAVLQHVQPARAGAAAGILTTTQQFGAASGIAVIGAIFYGALGSGVPSRGMFVHGMELGMTVDAVLLVAAALVTLLLPRRAASRPAVQPAGEPASSGEPVPEPALHAGFAE
ncbi:MAG TPA: MFS transporter [Streptosporangiaceae bacterium]|nr:MFS transporter [Streptosporangiaceae bacterium]